MKKYSIIILCSLLLLTSCSTKKKEYDKLSCTSRSSSEYTEIILEHKGDKIKRITSTVELSYKTQGYTKEQAQVYYDNAKAPDHDGITFEKSLDDKTYTETLTYDYTILTKKDLEKLGLTVGDDFYSLKAATAIYEEQGFSCY